MSSGDTATSVLYSFPHVLGRSGIGTTAHQQVLGLVAAGARVHVVCADVGAPLPPEVRVTRTLALGPARIPHRALGVDRAYRWHDRVTAQVVSRRADRYDVVHTWPLGAVRTLDAARSAGVLAVREAPNTHTAHAYRVAARLDAELGLQSRAGHSHAYDPARLALEEAEYEAADVVMVASPAVRQTFLDEGVPESRLELHRYGYDPARFGAPDPPPPARPPRPLTICFLGSLEPRKGLHVAVDAWRRSEVGRDGARLIVRGRAHPGYLESIGPIADEEGVDIEDFVADPSELLRSCDALVLPSFEEGSALVTYEAQASGCALLVSSAAGARCDHGDSGLVHEPGDTDALAHHLSLLAAEPETLGAMRSRAVERAASLTWSDAGRELLGVYERRIGRSGG